MSGGGRRSERLARTRDDLEAAALRLFAERGYHGTTVSDVAAATGVSRRTVFRYFDSKEEILYAHLPRLRAVLDGASAAATGDVDDVLVAVALALAQSLVDHGESLAIRARIVAQNPDLLDRAMRARGEWEAALARAVAEKAGAPEPTVAHAVRSSAVLAAVYHASQAWLDDERRSSLPTMVRAALADAGFPTD